MKQLRAPGCLVRAAGLILYASISAAWVPLGPFGGSAAFVVADPHSSKTFLAGTRNGLLFQSRDAGESWTSLPFPARLNTTLNALAIDPQTPGAYLAGISGDLPQTSGILRSTDSGATWRQVPGLLGQQVRAIAFKRTSSKIVAAGTDSGVFLSRDGCVTWTRISPADNRQLQPVVSIAFDTKDSDTLYAGTPHLPWKTSDGGANWRSIHSGMLDDSDIFSIVVDRNHPQRLFAGACSGIYRSINGGTSWQKLVEPRDASYRTYVIVQDPQLENVWFAGTTEGIIRSVDFGATWVRIGRFATRSIGFDPGRLGRILIAVDDAGILRSDDSGKSWRPANEGFCNRQLFSLWTAAGAVYTAVLEGPVKGNIVRLSADRSKWDKVTSSLGRAFLPEAALSLPWSPELLLAKSELGLFLSEDSGVHWKGLELPLATHIRTFAALDPPWIAAAGASGVFLSKDAKTWKACAPLGGDVYDVVSTTARGLLAATSSGLRASENLGASWHPVRGELESDTIQAICRHPRRPAWLFAAKYGVIYGSRDSGRTWTRLSSASDPIVSIRQLTVLPDAPDRLLVLTRQQGLWELNLQ